MLYNFNALDNFVGVLLQQFVVCGDVRFALGGVDNQNVSTTQPRLQLFGGRKASATHTGNTRHADEIDQCFRIALRVIAHRLLGCPCILAVWANNDTQLT